MRHCLHRGSRVRGCEVHIGEIAARPGGGSASVGKATFRLTAPHGTTLLLGLLNTDEPFLPTLHVTVEVVAGPGCRDHFDSSRWRIRRVIYGRCLWPPRTSQGTGRDPPGSPPGIQVRAGQGEIGCSSGILFELIKQNATALPFLDAGRTGVGLPTLAAFNADAISRLGALRTPAFPQGLSCSRTHF